MAQQSHSDETKAAVMASLLQGQSVSATAKEYGLPKGTVSDWKKKASEAAKPKGSMGSEEKPTQKSPEHKPEIGDLLVSYLQANLKALAAQTQVFADPDWLKTQSADSVAVLHGVMTDKAVRLLEAMSKASGEE